MRLHRRQLRDNPCAAEHGGEHDWSHAGAVIGIEVGAVLQQQMYDFHVALEGGTSERRLTMAVAAVSLRPVLRDHFHRFEVAVIAATRITHLVAEELNQQPVA